MFAPLYTIVYLQLCLQRETNKQGNKDPNTEPVQDISVNMSDVNKDYQSSEVEDDDVDKSEDSSFDNIFVGTTNPVCINKTISKYLAQHGEQDMLAGNHVVLFVGKPGCGKTTLSYMLCYSCDSNLQVCYYSFFLYSCLIIGDNVLSSCNSILSLCN